MLFISGPITNIAITSIATPHQNRYFEICCLAISNTISGFLADQGQRYCLFIDLRYLHLYRFLLTALLRYFIRPADPPQYGAGGGYCRVGEVDLRIGAPHTA